MLCKSCCVWTAVLGRRRAQGPQVVCYPAVIPKLLPRKMNFHACRRPRVEIEWQSQLPCRCCCELETRLGATSVTGTGKLARGVGPSALSALQRSSIINRSRTGRVQTCKPPASKFQAPPGVTNDTPDRDCAATATRGCIIVPELTSINTPRSAFVWTVSPPLLNKERSHPNF